MSAKRSQLSFESLRESAMSESRLMSYVVRLEMIRRQIQRECPNEVVSAVAYGRFLQLLKKRRTEQPLSPRNGLAVLVVTPLDKTFRAYQSLGEKVFGPVLVEFGKLVAYQVWTLSDLRTAREMGDELWKRVHREGVTIYGMPIEALDEAAPTDIS